MRPDTLSIILRSASFIALLQTAGMAIFFALFGRRLEISRLSLQRVAKLSAIAAAVFLVGQYLLEAARMADTMSGVVDPSLQMLVMHSSSSSVLIVRLFGLALIGLTINGGSNIGAFFSVIGALFLTASFMLTGHIAASSLRWSLALVLTIHVTIVAFWFGALVPLYLICSRETAIIAGHVTESFSRIAVWIVPGIFVAGSLLVLALVQNLADFTTGYGLSLLAKLTGFLVLMGLAALNKWRWGPAIASGDEYALKSFRRSLSAEYVLIAIVLSITAVMTTLYSPES